MKNTNLLLIGAAAIAAYFYFTKTNVAAITTTSGNDYSPPPNQTDAYNKKAEAGGATAASAITALNENSSSLKRTSSTIASGVSFTTSEGVTYSGNIAQLGTGAKVGIAVKPATIDKSGKTAFDRLIESNKAGKTSAQLARKTSV